MVRETEAQRLARHAALLERRRTSPNPPAYALPGYAERREKRQISVPGVTWVYCGVWDAVAPAGCEICSVRPRKVALALDHDHAYRHGPPGLRGFLCGPCNGNLGKYDDDPAEMDFWTAHFYRLASLEYANAFAHWCARAKAYLARTDCPHHQKRLAHKLRPDKYPNPYRVP